jgi:adenine phosphoribosyltransferase
MIESAPISDISLEQDIKDSIRTVMDFPKEGIAFKDITTLLLKPELSRKCIQEFADFARTLEIDAICGIEARGFILGMAIAQELNIPFIPIRKKGKLPAEKVSHTYDLEYGTDTLEIHKDAIKPGMKVMIHDDLLATGGTAEASSILIDKMQGKVAAYSFIITLNFLNGKDKLAKFSNKMVSLANY